MGGEDVQCAVQIDGLRGLSQEQYQQISEIQVRTPALRSHTWLALILCNV